MPNQYSKKSGKGSKVTKARSRAKTIKGKSSAAPKAKAKAAGAR